MIAALVDWGQSIEVVILGASPPPVLAPFGAVGAADMEMFWKVNVLGNQQLVAGVVKKILRKQKKGQILGILSEAMGVNDPEGAASNFGAYTISKYGLLGVLKQAKGDYPWLDVKTVSPAFIQTPMLDVFDDRYLELVREAGPIASAKEVSDVIFATLGLKDV